MATDRSGPVRAAPDWLELREAADARARDTGLADRLAPATGRLRTVHDLGGGTGSMARWLAPRLDGPQRWVVHDRDSGLLAEAGRRTPPVARDGAAVEVVTRHDDVTGLGEELAGADLVTASALLDMLTADEVDRLVAVCTAAGCPALITLSVVGRVALAPPDPLDAAHVAAFNDHQRRVGPSGRLLGPDAADHAAAAFAAHGWSVERRDSPWRLGAADADLTAAWLEGWLAAAHEQRPDLADDHSYAVRRRALAAEGRLGVVVGHCDLLVTPRPGLHPNG